jgi:hypothetical protein
VHPVFSLPILNDFFTMSFRSIIRLGPSLFSPAFLFHPSCLSILSLFLIPHHVNGALNIPRAWKNWLLLNLYILYISIILLLVKKTRMFLMVPSLGCHRNS